MSKANEPVSEQRERASGYIVGFTTSRAKAMVSGKSAIYYIIDAT